MNGRVCAPAAVPLCVSSVRSSSCSAVRCSQPPPAVSPVPQCLDFEVRVDWFSSPWRTRSLRPPPARPAGLRALGGLLAVTFSARASRPACSCSAPGLAPRLRRRSESSSPTWGPSIFSRSAASSFAPCSFRFLSSGDHHLGLVALLDELAGVFFSVSGSSASRFIFSISSFERPDGLIRTSCPCRCPGPWRAR